MTWKAVVDGELRDRALDAVREVAEALRQQPEQLRGDLSGGAAGLALLYAYAAEADIGVDGAAEAAAGYIDHAMDQVANAPMAPALHGGFTGVAWMIEHLRAAYFEDDGDDPCADIDDILLDLAKQPATGADYDLISGLTGLTIYALERAAAGRDRGLLAELVARFDEIGERSDAGLTWFTGPHLLPEHQRVHHPNGYYNLGVAHGMPATVSVLAQAHALGVDRAGELARESARWLLAQEQAPEVGSAFRWAFAPEDPPSPCRLAWCYGDAGVEAAMLAAGDALGDGELRDHALRLARSSAARDTARCGVVDAGICHGSAGLVQIYLRLHAGSGDATFADAARTWVAHTLDTYRKPELPYGGFYAHVPEQGKDGVFRDDPDFGFLTGATGVALALLAATTDVEPAWDRCLAVSGFSSR